MNSVLATISTPAAPQPKPASTNKRRLRAATRTPRERAASSSSRIACSEVPHGDLSKKNKARHEHHRERQRKPERVRLAEVGVVLVELDERDPGACPKVAIEPDEERDHLGDDHPAERELRRSKAKRKERYRQRDRARHHRGEEHRQVGGDAEVGE